MRPRAVETARTAVCRAGRRVAATLPHPRRAGTPSDRTLILGGGGAWRCVSLGSVYVAARVGAVCLLACVIACGLCEVPGGVNQIIQNIVRYKT